ncbi:MAG: PAS domain S-box protein [Nitrospiraceae bacterium]|nr:PAS domain S-box protein [Nitrospiraceae bacterium]
MTEFPKRPLRADRFLYVLVGTWTALILILAGAAGGHLYLATLAGAKARAMAYCEGSQAVLAWHASQRGGQIAPQDPQRLPVDDGAQSKVSPPDLSDLAEGSSGVRFRVTCLYTPCCGSKPDAWERVALEALAAGEPEFYEFVTRDGERRLRYMRPLILPEEGYRHIGLPCLGEDGEMVGASISLPMAPLLAQDRRTMVLMLGTFAVLWLAGWGGLVGVRRRLAERRSHSEELHYRSALEGIVARVSNAFLAAAPDEIDKVLEDALRTIGEFLDVDRCYATLLSEDRSHVERSYVWATPGLERHDDILKDAPVDAFPWAVKLFESGEVLHVPRLADLPPEAQAVKDLLEAQESLSIINVPLVSSTGLLGFFGLDMVREERTWEESVIDMLRVLGHTIGYAAERQRTSAKLRRSEEHFRQLFEAAPVSILLETLAGKVVNCNALACRVFGYSREELLSLHASDLIAGDARTIVEEVIAQQKATGGYSGRALNLRKGGESFPVEVATRIIELDDGPHALVILQDVTERTRAQEERRQLEAQVQHTQKLESLGVLAGGIAHDFNNLLTTVLGNVDLATSSLSRVSPANEYLFNIEGAARRAADLCRHMLAYSGKGSLEAQPIDLRGLVLEMANLLEVSISSLQLFGQHAIDRGRPDPTTSGRYEPDHQRLRGHRGRQWRDLYCHGCYHMRPRPPGHAVFQRRTARGALHLH